MHKKSMIRFLGNRVPSPTSIGGSLEEDFAAQDWLIDERNTIKVKEKNTIDDYYSVPGIVQQVISQLPAVIIAAGLNFMMVSRK